MSIVTVTEQQKFGIKTEITENLSSFALPKVALDSVLGALGMLIVANVAKHVVYCCKITSGVSLNNESAELTQITKKGCNLT